MPRRVAIVGASVTGLVAGRELARRGFAVTLVERWPDVAGQASAFEVAPGVWLERYYHHLFPSDREMVALHDELLPGQLEWHPSTVGIWSRGRVYPFVSPRDLLTYSPLPLADRVRLGLVVLRLVGRTDWERMDDIGALEWLRRTCGERALRSVWLPLMLGKFGDDAERIPLAWLWSKFVLRRGKGAQAGRERLGYPRGSFRAICVALDEDLRVRGGTTLLDREVVAIRADGDELVLHCAAPGAYRRSIGSAAAEPARELRADIVLLTTPTTGTAAITEWPADYRARLKAWTYRAAVVLLLELRRPYSDVYWMNVADMDVPFLGMVEHTNLIPAERYPARYLYVSNYVAPNDPLASLGPEALLQHYLAAMKLMNPSFVAEDVLRYWAFREDAAQPVPRIGNRHRILPFETPRRGIFVANTTQIYPEDRGTNYSVRLGRDVANVIAKRTG
ncbi:MAG TPA: FAD-dependent oxidoreductase [Candidatus Limnocylindria bacterium]|jgi:protoporphyrinogen oxidase|nr:FAD-dependent oxidoreductase [Candidatus Limnocylindria bacterium]